MAIKLSSLKKKISCRFWPCDLTDQLTSKGRMCRGRRKSPFIFITNIRLPFVAAAGLLGVLMLVLRSLTVCSTVLNFSAKPLHLGCPAFLTSGYHIAHTVKFCPEKEEVVMLSQGCWITSGFKSGADSWPVILLTPRTCLVLLMSSDNPYRRPHQNWCKNMDDPQNAY